MFDRDGEEFIVAARRPVHPLGKCFATTALLAYIIVAKYADGLPLYRLENILARSGHPVSRTQHGPLDHPAGQGIDPAADPAARRAKRQSLSADG